MSSTKPVTRSRNNLLIKQLTPYLLIGPAILIVMGILGYGVGWSFMMSLHKLNPLTFQNEFAGLATYMELFTSPQFQNALLRSATLVGGTILLGIIVSLSFALSIYKIQGFKGAVRAISLIPWMVSGIAAAVMFRFLFSGNAGLINIIMESFGLAPVGWLAHPTRAMFVLILTNTWFISPFSTLIILSGLQTIDTEIYDAAAVDGCSGVRTLGQITLPLIKPMFGFSLIWLSFASFNIFDVVLPTTGGGPGRATEVLAVMMYRLAFQGLDYPMASAIVIVLLIINAFMSLFYLKTFKV